MATRTDEARSLGMSDLDLTMQMTDGGETYPFVEDENANITGAGHQDKAAFAEAVNRYDEECTGEAFPDDDRWTDSDVGYAWVTIDQANEELFHVVSAGTPNAHPVTTLWYQR